MQKINLVTVLVICKNTGKVLWQSTDSTEVDTIVKVPKEYVTEEELANDGWRVNGDFCQRWEADSTYDLFKETEEFEKFRIIKLEAVVPITESQLLSSTHEVNLGELDVNGSDLEFYPDNIADDKEYPKLKIYATRSERDNDGIFVGVENQKGEQLFELELGVYKDQVQAMVYSSSDTVDPALHLHRNKKELTIVPEHPDKLTPIKDGDSTIGWSFPDPLEDIQDEELPISFNLDDNDNLVMIQGDNIIPLTKVSPRGVHFGDKVFPANEEFEGGVFLVDWPAEEFGFYGLKDKKRVAETIGVMQEHGLRTASISTSFSSDMGLYDNLGRPLMGYRGGELIITDCPSGYMVEFSISHKDTDREIRYDLTELLWR